jgi:stage II sporulation SpoAA-like protein
MLELIDGLPKNIVGIAVSGRLKMQDCEDVLVPAIQKSLKRHGKIRLYYELNSRFPGAAWDELELGLEDLSRCERVAIVTDIGWVRLTVKALRFLIPSEIRVFPTVQAEEGRAWIIAPPGSRSSAKVDAPAPASLAPSRWTTRSSSFRAPRAVDDIRPLDLTAVRLLAVYETLVLTGNLLNSDLGQEERLRRARTLRRTYECLRKRNPDFHDDSDQLRAARSIINKFQFQRRKAKAGHLIRRPSGRPAGG